ncbi:MAG: hypothetical protein A2275_18195 [Bacteroidetes bacterium RIFOXYA12_FULL_35_11]|nr:MAG: hypothetical protein A2X01_20760 [Bacteroidetes bacterium GWF2_35_48]OFY82693.1 MAG: hypothetical protein A2275_18195 [Bacteroidetes bacterium RIFOXYA12_FULL_35_11]OFY95345.1 MAG: hypothetical protein A2309_06440 [Bacteroidetes bacterium RIFOXYB2_FULL_35_7]HBX51795.1 DUF1751 domain-containing protein [Bacteroidales bacterium]
MFKNVSNSFGIPIVVKNLLILNILFFLGTYVAKSSWGFNLVEWLALYYPESEYFKPYQYITYMFMHGDMWHIFFNMYALWMFGRVLENYWGPKRFLIYYFVTGVGAALLHTFVNWWMISRAMDAATIYLNTPSPDSFALLIRDYFSEYKISSEFLNAWAGDPSNMMYVEQTKSLINEMMMFKINIPTVGASGAVFGVLLAFGMLFPNTQLMLLIPPIPLKAKYFVMIYGAIELYFAVMNQPGDNVAHFAHLGGMLFGFFLIRYWKKKQFDRWN